MTSLARLTVTLGLIAAGLCLQSSAEEPLFGPEIELHHWTHDWDLALGPFSNRILLKRLLRRHEQMCASAKCHVERLEKGAYRVVYGDGWWFQVDTDLGTLEVQAKPATLAEYRETYGARLQADLFDLAAKENIHPPRGRGLAGSGHINIDVKTAFGNDAKLFRNFLVDFANHAELAMGALNYDPLNARPIAAEPARKKAFLEVIARFDRGEIKTIPELARAIQNKIVTDTDALSLKSFTDGSPPEEWRVEIRSVAPQQNAVELMRVFSLFQGRIRYLARQPRLVRFLDPPRVPTREQALNGYHDYATHSGMDWAEAETLLPPHWRGYRKEGETWVDSYRLVQRCSLSLRHLFEP